MVTDESFRATIEAHYQESAPKLVYSDWLQEQGRWDEAMAWKWLGEQAKWPCRTPTFPNGWRYYWQPPGDRNPTHMTLPMHIINYMPEHEFESVMDAFDAAVAGLILDTQIKLHSNARRSQLLELARRMQATRIR